MNNIVIIGGPTAVGKTKVSIELAKEINGEIISADSMQIYKYFDIGSAKPTDEEMQGIKHYMVGEIDPKTEFSVSDYSHMSRKYIEEILAKGKVPIVVGGTGLYINSLIYDMDFSRAASDETYRKHLEDLAEKEGGDFVYNMLRDVDPESAKRIHKNNLRRVIRALEINKISGGTKNFKTDLVKTKDYNIILIGLKRNRMKLYASINKRVDQMVESGLLDEVKFLKKYGMNDSFTSMQGIGYKEVLYYLDNKYSYDQMITAIKTNSRRYAKRQLTWFKRYEELKWFDFDDYDSFEHYLARIKEFILSNL